MKGEHLKAKRADRRSRSWSFLLYPESLPGNWEIILGELCIPMAISPLHENDVYGEDSEEHKKGDLKKPHYHGVMCFESKKSFSQVKDILEPLNCPIPQVCSNARACIRYLIHLDNPDKAQYKREDIMLFGGMSIGKAFEPSKEEYSRILKDIYAVIRENEITEFYKLVDTVMDYNPEWIPVLAKNSYFIVSYLKRKYGRY